jgi:DNA-binding transcriptional regulator YiaG
VSTVTRTKEVNLGVETLLERVRRKRQLPSFAERRALREGAGLTLRDVARELDCSHTAVAKWETKAEPRGTRRVAYARLLEGLKQLAD